MRRVQRSQSSKNYEDPSETQNPDSQESCISAEIEFFSLLEDLISSGNILDMDTFHNTYHALLKRHNAEKQVESRRQLKEKIFHCLPDVDFCRSRRIYEPERLCSKAAKRIVIDNKLTKKDVSKEMLTLCDCSKMVRQEILKAHKDTPWKFKGS